MKKGIALVIAGAVGLIASYSLRPPSGLGDALMMMGQGREVYLREPVYLGLMVISGVFLVLGLVFVVRTLGKQSD